LELFPILSQGAASVGGGVALAFIVSLALGLVGLILVYGASAVVVLDGFARVSRRPVWPVLSGVAVALLAGIIGLQWNRPELALQS